MHQLQLIFVLSTFYSFLFLFLVVGGIEIVYYNINNEVTRPGQVQDRVSDLPVEVNTH